MTGAGGEASKARNAEVCLRAGWRMRRPAFHPRRQPPFKSEAHAGSADFDFLAGIPAAGTPAKKLVRIARMP